jgi:hypothetical protein
MTRKKGSPRVELHVMDVPWQEVAKIFKRIKIRRNESVCRETVDAFLDLTLTLKGGYIIIYLIIA